MFWNIVRAQRLPGRTIICCLLLLICGNVSAQTYTNPIIADGADPWVIRKDGFYYYTQTTGGNVRIRKASQIAGPNGVANASPVTVFTPPAPNNRNVWAPELHFLQGKWYIYFAADDGANANHRMYVAEAVTSNPQGLYILKGKIFDAASDRWAIDGTVLEMDDGSLYFVWSGWPGTADGLQNLYIAPMSNPWTISGPRVLLSTPTHGWEGWIHEGPQILKRNGKIFIVYSANASWTDNYCLGLLVNTNGNVLSASSWSKSSTPLFKTYSDLNGSVYGPGHCSFTKSLDGTEDFIFYHAAKFSGAGWDRNVRVQRFSWNANDAPNFDVPIPTSIPLTLPSGERPAPTPVTTFALALDPGLGGVRTVPQQLRYKAGSVVTLTASDYGGIRFTGWSGDVWKTNHSIAVTMDRNKTAVANFTRPVLLLDNPDATLTGVWTSSTISTQRIGVDYLYARTTNTTATDTARYRPNIPITGKYDVFALHSSGANRSVAAPWLVSSQEGNSTVHVNQQINGGVWQTLAAERTFAQGTTGFVRLSNLSGETNSVVIADAVAFIYSTNQAIAPVIYSQPLSQTVPLGGSVTLKVGVPGSVHYQWYFMDQKLGTETTAAITISNFTPQHEGEYRVVVSNAFGLATSSNALLKIASPVRVDQFSMQGSGISQARVVGPMGSNYVLETSADLTQWKQVETNLSINGIWDLTLGVEPGASRKFYRVIAR